MDKLPSLDKKKIEVASLNDIEEEKRYWMAKTPIERIEAIEINRRMVYGQDRVTSRLLSNGNELVLFFPEPGVCFLICQTIGRSITG
jgi:hypothetical protein